MTRNLFFQVIERTAGPASLGMETRLHVKTYDKIHPAQKKKGRIGPPFFCHRISKNSRGDYLLKLATASASVLYTSKMVISLVICSTSWNLVPRWHSFNAAPCALAL